MDDGEMVIDTSTFIDYLRAKNKAKTTLQNLPDDTAIWYLLSHNMSYIWEPLPGEAQGGTSMRL